MHRLFIPGDRHSLARNLRSGFGAVAGNRDARRLRVFLRTFDLEGTDFPFGRRLDGLADQSIVRSNCNLLGFGHCAAGGQDWRWMTATLVE